jgi:type II secretory pathway pseudopilin PulG
MSAHATQLTRVRALALGAALALAASSAAAAPRRPQQSQQQQQCIAAAESGQQLRSSGKLRDARKAFGPCTSNACAAVIRRDCGRWIDEIDAATPTFTVRLQDERGVDVSDGKVLVDGEVVSSAGEGHATPIDPGMHRVVWEREAGNISEELVMHEGEHNRVVVLRVPATIGPPSQADAPPVETKHGNPVPWIVGTAGVVLMAAGGAFWGLGLHDRSNLSVSCAGAHSCVQADVDASRTKLIVGDVLVGVGVVALAGAVYLWVRQSSGSSTSSAAAASR